MPWDRSVRISSSKPRKNTGFSVSRSGLPGVPPQAQQAGSAIARASLWPTVIRTKLNRCARRVFRYSARNCSVMGLSSNNP